MADEKAIQRIFSQTAETEPEDQEPEAAAPEEEQPQSSELILGKFKSYKDLEKAYKELESKLGRDSAEKKQLREELEALRKLVEGKTQPQAQPEVSVDDWFQRFYSDGPKAVEDVVRKALERDLQPIKETLKQLVWAQQIQAFRAKHPDMDEHADAMADIFASYPDLASHPQGLDIAYRLAKAQKLEQQLSETTEKVAEETKRRIAEKIAAQTPGSRSKPVTEGPKSPEEEFLERVFGPRRGS